MEANPTLRALDRIVATLDNALASVTKDELWSARQTIRIARADAFFEARSLRAETTKTEHDCERVPVFDGTETACACSPF